MCPCTLLSSVYNNTPNWKKRSPPINQNYNSAKCLTTARAQNAFCSRTQAWRVNYPFSCPITLSNYEEWCVHCPINAQIGLVITNHVRVFYYSVDYKLMIVVNVMLCYSTFRLLWIFVTYYRKHGDSNITSWLHNSFDYIRCVFFINPFP